MYKPTMTVCGGTNALLSDGFLMVRRDKAFCVLFPVLALVPFLAERK